MASKVTCLPLARPLVPPSVSTVPKTCLIPVLIIHVISLAIARTAALILHVDVVFILLPICRNFISLLRCTPLNDIIPFDKNITFHKSVAWSIVVFTVVHIVAHMVNFAILAIATTGGNPGRAFVAFLLINFTTGPGVTGWIMTVALGLMVWFAMEKRRRRPNGGFEWFYYVHYIGMIIFFVNWQLHGMFCMISACRLMCGRLQPTMLMLLTTEPDTPPYCSYNVIGVFWVGDPFFLIARSLVLTSRQRYWIVGGVVFLSERVLREIRSRHRTYISKIIQHPSNVMELQIKKEKITTRAGQVRVYRPD